MPIRGSSQVAEALKMLGVTLPPPSPMADVQPGMPGYDPTTMAERVSNPSVMDPTWLNVLRTGATTLGRVGEIGKGMITGGAEQPGPSAENLGAILGVLGPLLGKIVYHGSPHVFDKFDMSKIGTGEGAQAYGHGLYFADAPDVATSYQRGAELFVNGKPIEQANVTRRMKRVLSRMSDTMHPNTDVGRMQGDAWDAFKEVGLPQSQWNAFEKEWNKKVAVGLSKGKARGALYDVDLPDEAIAKMLDWDAPLSQQPEAVKELMRDRLKSSGYLRASDNGPRQLESAFKAYKMERGGMAEKGHGETIYTALSKELGSDEAASKALRAAGIPGIRYFDGNSRAAGRGSRNYVLFDDQIPKIVKVEQ